MRQLEGLLQTLGALGKLSFVVATAAIMLAVVAMARADLPATSRAFDGSAAQPEPTALPKGSDPPSVLIATNDPFQAKCARILDASVRELSREELAALDTAAQLRGGQGHWLVDGDRFAQGQGWINNGNEADVVAAHAGTAVNREGTWMITERNGQAVGMSVRAIALPSGLVLWVRDDMVIPVECPPGD